MGIIFTIIILGIIVFIHELGHFATAKYFGMPVTEFAIGMGPKIFSVKKKETVYSIRILPLGGFVNIEGMQPEKFDLETFKKEKMDEIIEKLKGEKNNGKKIRYSCKARIEKAGKYSEKWIFYKISI